MIEIFKTNISKESEANNISKQILKLYPSSIINFDLEDCDKILRIECISIDIPKVVQIVNENKFKCKLLI